ncbi:LytR/AlgR family response regulator transcription factor [Companilactobacillus muriivasis]|uniref:LytR/AlgR family response regulator transcription factor n=1 Tax=Companilactobacillus muriivasis TaxID=3081444 RepID=UPI0030C73299
MLLNILICEDNEKLRMYYQLIIKDYIKKHPEVEMKIVMSTGNPRDIDIYMESHINDIKFFLLDIEFPDSRIKGIDLATKIRKKDANAKIVFITTHEELTTMIFDRKVEPLDYIAKEIGLDAIRNKLYQDLDVAVERLVPVDERSIKEFNFNVGPKPYSVEIDQINYFESVESNHNIYLHSIDSMIEFIDTLRSIESRLPNFYRAHKSLLVNPENIATIDSKNHKLKFKDGSSCDVSRRKLVELKDCLNK